MIEFQMPSLGADMEDGTLVEWRKQPGDHLERGDIIADVETQKGLIEIEVFDEGILDKLVVEEGQKVPVGTVLALIKPQDGTKETKEETAGTDTVGDQPMEVPIMAKDFEEATGRRIKVTPLAKRIAAENKVNLSLVKGTGPEGAIVKEDVENALVLRDASSMENVKTDEEIEEPAPKIKNHKTAPPFSTIRSAVAAAMSRSNREIPHYYLEKKMDMSKALAWLKESNSQRTVQKRLLPVALLIKAVALSLDEVPDLNGVWEDGLQIKNEINIGFVVSLRSGGIVVPAIKHTDLKTVDEIMEALNDIIPRARAFKLRSSELTDTTITITNIGEGGADKVFGLIYPPQVAIVGFGNISEQPFAENGMLGIRPVLHVTVAGDHRATDGLIGSRFLASLNKHLQDPETL